MDDVRVAPLVGAFEGHQILLLRSSKDQDTASRVEERWSADRGLTCTAPTSIKSV